MVDPYVPLFMDNFLSELLEMSPKSITSHIVLNRNTDCTEKACSPQMVEVQSSMLTKFRRTFVWELKAPKKMFVSLNVLGEGLIEASQPCRDGLQYSVALSKTNIKDKTQYCRGGSVTLLKLVNEAVVFLDVKPEKQVDSVVFQASAGPLSKNDFLYNLFKTLPI